jgi:hypothetical protein
MICGCSPIALPRHDRRRADTTRGRQSTSAPAPRGHATGVQGYSPPAPTGQPDPRPHRFHTHAAPDVFGRAVDDEENFVLGTDLGQTGNPTPADGLQMFVTGLMAEGITRAQIDTMGREIPGALLMG